VCFLQRVVYHGRSLTPGCTLTAAGISTGSVLDFLPRLRGGGGDGGSTGAESRSSYLAMYAGKKLDKANPEEERLARWTTCQLSGLALTPPIVCDAVGNLYNKEAVIQALVGKTIPPQLGYITSLKHLTDLQVDATKSAEPGQPYQFSCPVTGLAFNGKNGFAVIRRGAKGPGYVFSERALKEMAVVVEEIVGGKWDEGDLLRLAPAGEELEDRRKALAAEREKERAEKRGKKAKRAETNGGLAAVANGVLPVGEATNGGAANGQNGVTSHVGQPATKKSKVDELRPAGADPAVWSSLFAKKREPGAKRQNDDYMLRGQMKYVN
jgi:Rtf2 RING-finger